MRGGKRSSRIVLLTVFGILILLTQIGCPTEIQQAEQQVPERLLKVIAPAYTPHGPIVISSNNDFETQNWPGNGTVSDPYLIEGLNITYEGISIDIQATSVHYLIQDCFLRNPLGVSLNLEYSHNGTINRCDIAGGAIGLYVFRSNDTIIANSTIDSSINTFMATQSHRVLLLNSTLLCSEKGYSVSFGACSSSSVTDCTFTGAILRISECINLIIRRNNFSNGGLSFWPYEIENIYWNHSISGNNVNGKPLGYFKDQSAMILDGDSYGEVVLYNCTRMKVEGGRIEDAVKAIQIVLSPNCTVSDLEISGWGAGITIFESNYTIIDNCYKFGALNSGNFITITKSSYCRMTSNLDGGSGTSIWIDSGSNHFLNGNRMFPNLWGIALLSEESDSCIITSNFVMGCQIGINVDGSRHTILNNTIIESRSGISGTITNAAITDNMIRQGLYDGISISSNNSIITGNWITENDRIGIRLHEGSNGNKIFNNSIGRNAESNAHDDGFSNLWDDNVSIGNLWGDFPGMTPPYQIPGAAGSEDRYPLSDTIPPVLDGLTHLNTSLHHNFPIQWYAFD
ncbi:MAG: NosD domain-containing protein, partial [Candidatus Thorarchaeota archaeon]